MADPEVVETLLDSGAPQLALHGLRTKLDEHPLSAVLHRGEPRGLQGDLRALDVSLVLPMDVRRHRLKARKTGQGQNLPQTMKLDDGRYAVKALGAPPDSVGEPASMEIRIDGYVVAKAVGHGASLSAILGFFFMNARSLALSTICKSSQSFLTAVSTAVPLSGSERTVTTWGK